MFWWYPVLGLKCISIRLCFMFGAFGCVRVCKLFEHLTLGVYVYIYYYYILLHTYIYIYILYILYYILYYTLLFLFLSYSSQMLHSPLPIIPLFLSFPLLPLSFTILLIYNPLPFLPLFISSLSSVPSHLLFLLCSSPISS